MIQLRRPAGEFARVGHRGAPALARENTLRSLQIAVELGCDMLEFDVLDLVDGTLVLAHSNDLHEVSHGVSRGRVRRRTLEALRRVAPELPTLDEALAFCADRLPGIALQVDLKRRGVERAVVEALRRHRVLDRSWVSGFDAASLRRVAALEPDLARSYTLPRDRFGISKRGPLAPVVRRALASMGASLPRRLPHLLSRAHASAATLHHSVASTEAIARARGRSRGLRLDGRRPEARRTVHSSGGRRYHHERSEDFCELEDVKRVSLLLSIVAGLAVAGVLAPAPAADPPPGTTTTVPTGTIAAGVTIAGVDVAGLTREAAAAAVQEAFQTPLELQLGTTRVLVTPDVLGAAPVLEKALDRALAAAPDTAVPLGVTVAGDKMAAFVAELAKRFDRKPVDSNLLLRHLRPWLSKERAGRKLEQRRAVRDITAALTGSVRESIVLDHTVVRAKVTRKNFGPVIVIRRGLNRLLLYNGMRYRRFFGVATGQRQYPTPLGRFTIVVKWKNPWWYPPNSPWAQGQKPIPPGPDNPLGTRWMGLSSPGVGIHGTPSDASIGYSVSHGCIRMHIPEAEWLFNYVDVGTTVFIVSA